MARIFESGAFWWLRFKAPATLQRRRRYLRHDCLEAPNLGFKHSEGARGAALAPDLTTQTRACAIRGRGERREVPEEAATSPIPVTCRRQSFWPNIWVSAARRLHVVFLPTGLPFARVIVFIFTYKYIYTHKKQVGLFIFFPVPQVGLASSAKTSVC